VGGELVSGNQRMLTLILLIGTVLLTEMIGATPLYASLCQISNIAYDYPQKVAPSQSFSTTVNVSGVCVRNFDNSYMVRVDLSSMSGQILSSNFGSVGYGTGQSWQVTVSNKITAAVSGSNWQIRFNVYVFGNGDTGLIYQISKPVTIQISTT